MRHLTPLFEINNDYLSFDAILMSMKTPCGGWIFKHRAGVHSCHMTVKHEPGDKIIEIQVIIYFVLPRHCTSTESVC
jgi:hypothetical protein